MRRFSRLCAVLILVAVAAAAETAPVPAMSEASRLLARNLPRIHLSHRPFDDQLAADALQLFLDSLDYEHVYFLASDVASFRDAVTNLDDQVAGGDPAFAQQVYEIFVARVSNRVACAEKLLEQGFDLDRQETYRWKRKDEPRPADERAWDELWRKKVKNQYIARVVADRLAEEEKAAQEEEPDEDALPAPQLTPEEFVMKGYRNYLTVLNDNDAEWIVERYLSAFAQAYDPHTDYLSASNTEDFNIGMKLSLVGIGAVLSSEDGAAKVERIIPGGPAERDGRLQAGDKIIAVGQDTEEPVDILHWPLSKAVRLIRGEKDTRVVLVVIPASDVSGSTTKRIDIIRDEVRLSEQAAKSETWEVEQPDGAVRKLGILTLPEFYMDAGGRKAGQPERSSSADTRRLLGELKEGGVEGIVLDLRNNGGGLLTEAVEMAGLFIPSGPVVQVRDARGTQVLSDSDPDLVYDGPMVVLVNRQTASASEIVAGALQDYERAVIAGDSRTHGKGTVQSMIDVRRGEPALGTLKVTTATFYRIGGASTQLKGVTTDIIVPTVLDEMDIGEEKLPHALPWSVVYPALYRPYSELDRLVPELAERSAKRRKDDVRYTAYEGLLSRLNARQESKEISLRLDDRLELARSEKELQKMLRSAGPDKQEETKEKDVVMTEALHILLDLIDLQKHAPGIVAESEHAPLAAVE